MLHERTKSYKTWKDAEAMLGRKRENRTKFSMQNKHEKVALADREIAEVLSLQNPLNIWGAVFIASIK